MHDVLLPADALSHGQIKSKIWLSQKLNSWISKHIPQPAEDYTLNWYGSWVGMGPFLFLAQTQLRFLDINLIDLDGAVLEKSRHLLEYWRCEWSRLHTLHIDFNQFTPSQAPDQFFFNTACEHDKSEEWLEKIPKGSYIVMQSTNMPHPEHVNSPIDLRHFVSLNESFLTLLESDQLDFKYPDKSFSRFMIFGVKK
ncbi:MAG: hypothetical protein ACXWQQ_12625 [Pseudobdellovibrio sp.]